MGREVTPSSNSGGPPNGNEAESSGAARESVEELQKRQEQYPVWSSGFEYQQTLDFLGDHDGNGDDRKSLDMSLVEMSEAEARQLGEAVASHKSLEVLKIKLDSVYEEEEKLASPTSMWPMDSFLTAAFLGPELQSRNTSVLTLVIANSSTDGDTLRLGVLPQVLRENKCIRQFSIQWSGDDGSSREEMQDLFEALKLNSTIESLTLPSLVRWDFPDSDDQGFLDAETVTQIVSLVERMTLHKLELHIGECRGPGSTDVNLDAFYRALKSGSGIRFLRLRGPFFSQIAESEFSSWLRTTSTLRELQLENCLDDESPVLKALFKALRDNKSLRKLKLEDYLGDEDEDLEELLNALRENSTIQEIFFDPESDWEEAVTEALQKNLPQ